MRVPNEVQQAQHWRIHELVEDFRLEDVWSHPRINGAAGDFDAVVRLMTSGDPMTGDSVPVRLLWNARDLLGRWFDLGSVTTSASTAAEGSLRSRVALDLRGTADDVAFDRLPFVPLYRTDDEFAAEVINRTVHGVMHLTWVPDGEGRHHGQMAVYVKPNGLFGRAYMAFIKPFRYLIVYPALERQIAHQWESTITAAGRSSLPPDRTR